MKIIDVQTSSVTISPDHDHDISFSSALDDEGNRGRLLKLGGDNTIYAAFSGDPTIQYTFSSNTSTEITRLKKLANSCPYVVSVEKAGNVVTLYTDFDSIPTNALVNITSPWVSPDADWVMTSGTTPLTLTRLVYELGGSVVSNTSLCIVESNTVSINTTSNKVVYVIDPLTVNGKLTPAGQRVFVTGNTSLTSDGKAKAIIIEYTNSGT